MTETLDLTMILKAIPGPSRKRVPSVYSYRNVYRHAATGPGECIALWEVSGGRESYQVAVERTGDGGTHAHCTCPDSVYRGALDAKHECKHVRGLRSVAPLLAG